MTSPNKSVHTGMVSISSPAVKGHKRRIHTGARLLIYHNGGSSSIYAHLHVQLTFNILFLQAVTINLPSVALLQTSVYILLVTWNLANVALFI